MADVFSNVKRDTPLDVIKQAWIEGAKHCHPDVGGDADAMALINRAWDDAQREHAHV